MHVLILILRLAGLASWYSLPGSEMADAHVFEPARHICATRHAVPYGTRLSIMNTDNGNWSWCIAEDYGPAYYTGRILDVSPAVAHDLKFDGIAPVKVYVAIPVKTRKHH